MTTGWYDMRQSALGSQVVVQALYWSASPNAGNNNNAWNVNFNNNMVVRGADGRMKILSAEAPGHAPASPVPSGTSGPVGNPNANQGSAVFGRITSAGAPRVAQVALKLLF